MVCSVTVILSTIYYVQVINFSVLLKDLGVADPKSIGLSMALPSIGVPIGAIVFKLTTRFGAAAQIVLVFICFAVGLGGIGIAPDYKVALAFAFVQQLANGIIVPALIAWTQSKFSFEHRGRGMGWWASSFFVAQFLSPAVVNLMRGWVGNLQGRISGLRTDCRRVRRDGRPAAPARTTGAFPSFPLNRQPRGPA
ncbi:MFS transporter [Pseudoduganella sp. UC29_106]|uniref:MFS transporter n=1 Tax=Pseudoduganella sp. UC29_106 TaxID=3374553 RepID=UPI00375786B7